LEPEQVIPPGEASNANPQRPLEEVFSTGTDGEDGLEGGEATGVGETLITDADGVMDTRPTDDEATELQVPNRGLQPLPQ
jgi:hypothetical protein